MLQLSLKSFLDFATYGGLFDYISLANHPEIADAIEQADPQQTICIIDRSGPQPLLYTFEGWIREKKRRTSLEESVEIKWTKDQLKGKIINAVLKGDEAEAKKFQELYKRL